MTWQPTTIIEEDIGRFQVVVDGIDVTFFRGIPTPIPAWDSAEPFDDSTVTLVFPQITPFEPKPTWLHKFASVDINLIHPDGTIESLWEGMVATVSNVNDGQQFNRTAECFGALYQLDLFVAKPPSVQIKVRDIGEMISDEFLSRPSMRVAPINVPITGVRSLAQSSPNTKLLTGYVQDLLQKATVSISPGRDSLVVGIADCPTGSGYWLAAEDGSVIAFGERTPFFGTMANQPLNQPVSGIASDPMGRGYWLVAQDGGVFAFGEVFAGSAVPIVGMSGRIFVDIEPTPSGDGYWIIDSMGEVYSFGDAVYHGGAPNTSGSLVVGMARTPDGGGYWILDQKGAIYSYGNAVYHGNGMPTGLKFAGIESHKQGDGYWLLTQDGHVFGYGDAVSYGPPLAAYNLPPVDLVSTSTGNGYHYAALDGGVFSYGDAVFRGSVPGGGGVPHQWTLMKNTGRLPVIRVKDTWTEHWHVTTGAPGIIHSLKEDFTMEPNVIYGEGLDPEGCWWRNTKYPRHLGTDIVWPGRVITLGMSGDDVSTWQTRMAEMGYDVGSDGVYRERDRRACLKIQQDAQILVDGKLGPQTWVATFHPGEDADNLFAVHYAPLVEDPRVEQFTYAPDGSATGSNPDWDPSLVRVERWEMFGANIRKDEGFRAAEAELARANFARLSGTIVLKSDPEEGSRYRMKAGQNIVMRALEGEDIFFHIAQAQVDAPSETVTLTVDMSARDLMTLQAVWERDRAAILPSRVPDANAAVAISPNTQIIWDCDAGAGVIPRMGIYSGLWNVIRIPGGQTVDIQQMILWADDDQSQLSMAVFDRPITDDYLRSLGDPLNDDTYWQDFPTDKGLVVAWGGAGQPGGYWPGLSSNGDSTTGVMVDQSSWHFESTQAPWMWVAVWSDTTTYVQGDIQPYFSDLPSFSGVTALGGGGGGGSGFNH